LVRLFTKKDTNARRNLERKGTILKVQRKPSKVRRQPVGARNKKASTRKNVEPEKGKGSYLFPEKRKQNGSVGKGSEKKAPTA